MSKQDWDMLYDAVASFLDGILQVYNELKELFAAFKN